MKKIALIFLAICILPLFSCSAIIESQIEELVEAVENYSDTSSNSKGHITLSKDDALKIRKFDIKDYHGLSVGYSFQVVMCDTVDKVTVRVNEKLDKYLVVKVDRGRLKITLDRIGGIHSKDNSKCGYIYLPYNTKLSSVKLRGTSSFATVLPMIANNFDVDMSGATSFKGKVSCTNFDVDLSGTSRCRTDVKCKALNADLSGASELESNMECTTLAADLSGTSKITGNIGATNIDADMSGASKMELAGKCNNLQVEVSGTGELHCKKLAAKRVSGEMSGASNVVINCSEYLEMELTGTSHLIYYGNPKTDIDASIATTVEKK